MPNGEGPILPYELEEVIFTESARSLPSSAPNLMLVAQRVHQWVGNIIYGTSHQLLKEAPFPDTTKGPGAPSILYFGQFVKHLIIGGGMEFHRVELFLQACPQLIDLALWTALSTKDFLPLFANLKLQRLSTNLSSLDESDFMGPSFSSITHLDVTIFSEDFERWKAFKYLPALTHLAINDPVDRQTVQYLLDHCPKVRILLVIDDSEINRNVTNLTDAGIYDPRFVLMDIERLIVKDWENGTTGEEDIWACAQGISAAKRRGSFLTEKFCTFFTRHGWRDELDELEKEYASS